MRGRWLAVSALLLTPMVAFPQDLAAAARKEKERRARIAKPTKVYTEGDGKEGTGGSVTTMPQVAVGSSPASADDTASVSAEAKARWKARSEAAKAGVTRAIEAQKAAESQIETLRNDMAPLSAAEALDPMRRQKQDAQLSQLTAQLPKLKEAVVAAKKALADFEDEARKSGVPPGWLR